MSNTNTLTDYVLMPSADYIDMCNAIREKTGITGDLISSQLGNIIRNIQGSVVLPTHTINFYNDTTLLQSYANIVYGSTVIYTGETPTKASTATMSYTFDRFEPSGARITGDTNCYAQFIETAIGGGDDGEVTYGWVPFAADGTSYTGETVLIPGQMQALLEPFEFILSDTNQYRVTIDGIEYSASIIDRQMVIEGFGGFSIVVNGTFAQIGRVSSNGGVECTLKIESWAAIAEPEEPTTGEWVPFCADGTTWTGEEVYFANTGKGVMPVFYEGNVIISPANQYRFTLNDGVYEGVNISEDANFIRLENCPYLLQMYSDTDHRFNFIGSDTEDLYYTGTLKVESWTGSEPYVPEEEGYVPTDGYQAFTTDGTWTGESVTANSVTDVFLNSNVKWAGVPSSISEGQNALITVDGVSYECVVTEEGSPKSRYVITCDGCPVSIEGGPLYADNYYAVFPTAGTYTLKVEVKNETETPTLITFSIAGTEYQAEEGMTWTEWTTSEYNTGGFYVTEYDDIQSTEASGEWVQDNDYNVVSPTATIIANYSYHFDCCFVAGTQVMISLDGQTKNIEDIQEGEQVVSYDVKTGENYLATVSKTIINNGSRNMAHIEFEDGSELDMTQYHPIYTQNGWHSLTNYNGYDTLVIGDIVKTANGWSKITDIILYQNDRPTATYTLNVVDINENPDVDVNDSFYANSIVVHNTCF